MISQHVYRAFLVGAPDVELSLMGGTITLDDTTAPHVQGGIDIAWPGHWDIVPDDGPVYGGPVWVTDDELLEALDPRQSPRVRVTVDATYPTFSTSRFFDLGVRDWDVSQTSRVVSLTVTSDEARLGDSAPLADDQTPLTHQASLRAVVNYVLNQAIPGSSLEATPGVDADATRYWTVSNLITNPSFEVNTAGWTPGANAGAITRTTGATPPGPSTWTAFWSSTAAAPSYADFAASTGLAVRAGRSYVFTTYMLGSAARPGRVMIRFKNPAGVALTDQYSAPVVLGTVTWTRLVVIATAPPGATQASLHVEYGANAVGQNGFIDDAMFYEGDALIPNFNGSTPASSTYTYAWSGPVHASVSTRTPVSEAEPDALIWRAGQSAIDFLHPLLQASGLRLVCDEQRRWTLRDAAFTAEGSTAVRYGVNLIDGTDRISRDNGYWFDAAVRIYRWTDSDGTQQERVDSFALNDPPTLVNRQIIEAPFPGPGLAEYAVQRAQGRGREVTVTTVADWRANAEQSCTIRLDGTPAQLGRASRIAFDLGPGGSRDRMTITARTTDTIPDAVNLLDGTVNELVGTVNDLP